MLCFVIDQDPFGLAVATSYAELNELTLSCISTQQELPEERENPAITGFVLVSSNLNMQNARLVEQSVRGLGKPLLLVLFDGATLQLGPLLQAPGHGCLRCHELRQRQHDSKQRLRETLDQAYYAGTARRPSGFPHYAVILAAAQLERFFDSAENADETRGLLWRCNLFSGEITSGRLDGIHGCEVCGGVQATGDEQTCLRMKRELSIRFTGPAAPM